MKVGNITILSNQPHLVSGIQKGLEDGVKTYPGLAEMLPADTFITVTEDANKMIGSKVSYLKDGSRHISELFTFQGDKAVLNAIGSGFRKLADTFGYHLSNIISKAA